MKWLARLKNQKGPDPYATKATETPGDAHAGVFVGFVAYPQGHSEKSAEEFRSFRSVPAGGFAEIEGGDADRQSAPANDATPDPDRWCWPHSDAMNTREVDTFTARLARFTDRGMGLAGAERLADALVQRDRAGEDRRACAECIHLHGAGPWRCSNWKQAGVATKAADAELPGELVMRQQRCPGFAPAITMKGGTP